MKNVVALVLFTLSQLLFAEGRAAGLDGLDIKELMDAVVRYHQENIQDSIPPAHSAKGESVPTHAISTFDQSTFFLGLLESWKYTRDSMYLEYLHSRAKDPRLVDPRRHENLGNICIAGDLQLCDRRGKHHDTTGIREALATAIDAAGKRNDSRRPSVACFALAPAYALLAKLSGEDEYRELMAETWFQAYYNFYDHEDHLFYRDRETRFDPDHLAETTTANGRKIFSARANGRVLTGICRLLDLLPANYPRNRFYIEVFEEMAATLKNLQQPDGLWTASLFDSLESPDPELGGSALFCYGLAYGLNHGYLEDREFGPVVREAWKALADGMQPLARPASEERAGREPPGPGARPAMLARLGSFLLAAKEVLRYRREPPERPPGARKTKREMFYHIETWSEKPGTVEVCWVSAESLETGKLQLRCGDRDFFTGWQSYTGRNHKVSVKGLDPECEYHLRITSKLGYDTHRSDWFTVRPAAPSAGSTLEQEIEISVNEPTDFKRGPWPVRGGIPFARGRLGREADLKLFDGNNEEVPLETAVFTRWPDGSIKWLTISFLGASGERYLLRTSASFSSGSSARVLQFTEDPRAVNALGIHFAASGGVMLHRDLFVRGIGKNYQLVDGHGRTLTAGAPARGEVTVEENGPLCAILRWEGSFERFGAPAKWSYLIRATFWKGQPRLGLSLSLIDNIDRPRFSPLTSLSYRVPFGGTGNGTGSLGRHKIDRIEEDAIHRLRQYRDDGYHLAGGAQRIEGEHATGYAHLSDGATAVSVFVEDFWQTYPKGLDLDAGGITVQLLPELPTDMYTTESDLPWASALYQWCHEGKYYMGGSQLNQDRVSVYWGQSGSPEHDKLGRWLANPLLPQVAREYRCDTKVLGETLVPQRDAVWQSYDRLFEDYFQDSIRDQGEKRAFGWLHYGDWRSSGDTWGNNEYDMAWAMGLQWFRTGRRAYFDRGLAMARHHSTVDQLHGPIAGRARGLTWSHKPNHFDHRGMPNAPQDISWDTIRARYFVHLFPDEPWQFREPNGHIYQEGNWLYAALLGDDFLRESALAVCENQVKTRTPSFDFGFVGICRDGGWPLINAVAAYRFTSHPYYLNAARVYVETALGREDRVNGGWPGDLIYDRGPNGKKGYKDFAVGILTYGLLRYLEVEPGNRADVKDMLAKAADGLMENAWNESESAFWYITCTDGSNYRDCHPDHGLLLLELFVFVHEHTGEEKYLSFARKLVKEAYRKIRLRHRSGNYPLSGKAQTMATRQTIFGLSRLVKYGITD